MIADFDTLNNLVSPQLPADNLLKKQLTISGAAVKKEFAIIDLGYGPLLLKRYWEYYFDLPHQTDNLNPFILSLEGREPGTRIIACSAYRLTDINLEPVLATQVLNSRFAKQNVDRTRKVSLADDQDGILSGSFGWSDLGGGITEENQIGGNQYRESGGLTYTDAFNISDYSHNLRIPQVIVHAQLNLTVPLVQKPDWRYLEIDEKTRAAINSDLDMIYIERVYPDGIQAGMYRLSDCVNLKHSNIPSSGEISYALYNKNLDIELGITTAEGIVTILLNPRDGQLLSEES